MSEPTLVERMQQLLASYPVNMSLLLRPKGEAGGIITATEWVDLNDLRALLAENARLLAELVEARKMQANAQFLYETECAISNLLRQDIARALSALDGTELNMNNYAEDDVSALNEAGIAAWVILTAARSHPVAQKATDAET